jgi:DnaJ-class molecular chaperone
MSAGPDEEAAGARAAGRGSAEDRTACTPCRGTGRVKSSLGGQAHELTCPWCGGSGRFIPGRDAQAEPAESPDSAA